MAQAALVRRELTPGMIDAGKKLLTTLDRDGFDVAAAFWLYGHDADFWRLMMATSEPSKAGPQAAYARVKSALTRSSEASAELRLEYVYLVDPKTPLVRALRRAIRTGKEPSEIRFTNNAVDGMLIEDALIYRST